MSRLLSCLLAGVLPLAFGAGRLPAQIADEAGPRAEVRRQFLASGLRPGDAFPDLQIYAAGGDPFRTADLKGGYAVLVTGCLT
jgi:hypothetical protein